MSDRQQTLRKPVNFAFACRNATFSSRKVAFLYANAMEGQFQNTGSIGIYWYSVGDIDSQEE